MRGGDRLCEPLPVSIRPDREVYIPVLAQVRLHSPITRIKTDVYNLLYRILGKLRISLRF